MNFSAKITDLTVGINNIMILTGPNYKQCKDTLEIILRCLDVNIALQQTKPHVHVEGSLENVQNANAQWMRSNRLCLQVMQKTIPESFKGPVSNFTIVLDYLKEHEQMFVRDEKVEISILLNKLYTMKYNDISNVTEHILEMMNTTSKLKAHSLFVSQLCSHFFWAVEGELQLLEGIMDSQ
jgi:hypothetical protein